MDLINNETKVGSSDLIAKIKAIQEEHDAPQGLSLAQISRESGIPKSTLSQFLNGLYEGNNEKIAKQAQCWVDAYEARRKISSKIKEAPDFLMLPSSRRWLQVFEYAQLAHDIGVVTGAPGTSKTWSADYYCKTHNNAWLITADHGLRTPRALLADIAETVGAPVKSGPSLMRGVIGRLKNTTGLLIIDEAQHLTTEALDQLRSLNDRAGVGMAWMGNEPLRGRIEGMGQQAANAQIFSRVGMWKSRKKPTSADIGHVLSAWEVEDPELEPLLRWIGSREGGLRELDKTLKFAFYIAGNDKRTALQRSDIEAGWNQRKPTLLPQTPLSQMIGA